MPSHDLAPFPYPPPPAISRQQVVSKNVSYIDLDPTRHLACPLKMTASIKNTEEEAIRGIFFSTSKMLHLPPQNDDSGLAVKMFFR